MLVIGILVLTSINTMHIGISFLTDRAENAAEEEMFIAQNKVDLARQLEVSGATLESKKNLSMIAFLIGAVPGNIADPENLNVPFLEELENQLIEVDHAETIIDEFRSSSAEDKPLDATEQAYIDNIESKLADYRVAVNEIANEQIPARGDMESGLAGDVMAPLLILNETVDASNAIALVSNYIANFQQDIVLVIPSEIGKLKTEINEAELSDEERENLLTEVDNAQAAYLALVTHDINLGQNVGALSTLINESNTEVRALIEYEFANEEDARSQLNNAADLRIQLQILSALLTIGVGMTVAFFVSRLITNPLTKLIKNAEDIAQGDYSQKLSVNREDEVGRLSTAFNQMTQAIRERNESLEAQAEELKLAKNEAEESNRLKSEFLATMSHEIRTPLNAIEGFSSIMLAGMGVNLEPEAQDMVKRISVNSSRLIDLINDMLDLTRIEAGRVEIRPEPVAVTDMIMRWENEVQQLLGDKPLTYSYEVDPKLPKIIETDWNALHKVVSNLLVNAVKYTESGSIKLGLTRDAQHLLITVQDTGIGISPEAQTYIFDEFRQVDGSFKRKHGGVGLGLAIVQKLVRLMQGTVTVQSKLGEGSVFSVRLPLNLTSTSSKP